MTAQERTMKKVANTYLDVYGNSKDREVTLESGNKIVIVAPNRFGYGYMRLIFPASNEVWSSDFNKNGKIMNCHGEKINPINGDRIAIK